MKTSRTKTVLLEVAGVEGEVTVEFDYWPETPDVMYLPNGDPGYPGEPAEIEITAIYFGKLEVSKEFTSEQITAIEEAILEEGPSDE